MPRSFLRPDSPSLGRRLFCFAVVADTHVNERDGSSNSPYLTNALANERARHVFQDIAAMSPAPEFVIHLGDIVHPVPSVPGYHEAVAQFKAIAAPLPMPLHVVPGNHDVGDKRVDWMPADQVCEQYLQIYRAAFGADHYAFDRGDLRFVFVNSLLLNSGLPQEQAQREWLQAQLASAQDQRVFLFMHYPPYIHSPDERGNYDNIDEPARGWLLEQMQRPGVEGVFAGHVHNFWYDRIGDAEFYMLPSTAFLRHDFAEFYRVAPSQEFGRGDVEKFGYFVVDVFEHGHVAYSIRTLGQRAPAGAAQADLPERHLAHPKTSSFDRIGVELRHPWAESMQITATGGVQEFGRKWARNDYPLLALWEMGARLSKLPDIDLLEDEPRERMRLMARLGHRYVVTTLGLPKPALLAHDPRAHGVVAFEVNATLENFERQRDALKALRADGGCEIFFSKILTYDDSHFDGQHYSHFVKAGFAIEELDAHADRLAQARATGQIDGITVRIEADRSPLDCAAALDDFARRTGCSVLASLKLAGPSLAVERADDRGNVAKVAQAMILSKCSTSVRYLFDTFMDVDRGYFPRHAFIDRRFNPRPAAQAFTTLTALLSRFDALTLRDDAQLRAGNGTGSAEPDPRSAAAPSLLAFQAGEHRYLLGCATAPTLQRYLGRPGSVVSVHDLVNGNAHSGQADIARLYERLCSPSIDESELQVLLIREI